MTNIYQYLEPWQLLYFLTMFAGVLIGVGSSYILNVFKNNKELEIIKKRFAKMSREYTNEREETRKELDRILKFGRGQNEILGLS